MEKMSKDKSSQLPDFNLPNKLLKLEEELELEPSERLLQKKMLPKNSLKAQLENHMLNNKEGKISPISKDLKSLFSEEDYPNYLDQEKTENDQYPI